MSPPSPLFSSNQFNVFPFPQFSIFYLKLILKNIKFHNHQFTSFISCFNHCPRHNSLFLFSMNISDARTKKNIFHYFDPHNTIAAGLFWQDILFVFFKIGYKQNGNENILWKINGKYVAIAKY